MIITDLKLRLIGFPYAILQAKKRRVVPGKKRVEIGSSGSGSKCVADPGHVHCDNTAEQLGRTGEHPDTFHIYHEGTQIPGKTRWMEDLYCKYSGNVYTYTKIIKNA